MIMVLSFDCYVTVLIKGVPLYRLSSLFNIQNAFDPPPPPFVLNIFFDRLGGTLHCSKIGQNKETMSNIP